PTSSRRASPRSTCRSSEGSDDRAACAAREDDGADKRADRAEGGPFAGRGIRRVAAERDGEELRAHRRPRQDEREARDAGDAEREEVEDIPRRVEAEPVADRHLADRERGTGEAEREHP